MKIIITALCALVLYYGGYSLGEHITKQKYSNYLLCLNKTFDSHLDKNKVTQEEIRECYMEHVLKERQK